MTNPTQEQLRDLVEVLIQEIGFETQHSIKAVKDPNSYSAVLIVIDSGPIKGTNGVSAQDCVRFSEYWLHQGGSVKRVIQKFYTDVQMAIDNVDDLVKQKELDTTPHTD